MYKSLDLFERETFRFVRTKEYMLIIIVKTKRPSTERGSFVMGKILIKTKKNLYKTK